MECMKTEIDGIEGIYKDIAEDSLRKEVALTNATAAKKAAEDCFRDKFPAYQTRLAALAEERRKAIVAVEDENAKDEVMALNLLKQVEELRERQRNRLDTQKKGLQHTQLLETHEEEGMQSASNYLKAAKDEFNEKEESARLAKAKTLLLDGNLTWKKLELEQMRKELNELREFASSHNSWGGGVARVPPEHLALAQQDYNEIISDFVHHMDDNDIASVLNAILKGEDLKSSFLKYVKNTGIVYNKHFPDDPKIRVCRERMGPHIVENHPQLMDRIVRYFTAPKVMATVKSFEGQQPSLDAAAQSRTMAHLSLLDLPPRTPGKKRSASDIDYVNSTILQSPHLKASKKKKLNEYYDSANSFNSLYGGFISSPMHESPLIEIRSAKNQEQRGNTSSPSVSRKM